MTERLTIPKSVINDAVSALIQRRYQKFGDLKCPLFVNGKCSYEGEPAPNCSNCTPAHDTFAEVEKETKDLYRKEHFLKSNDVKLRLFRGKNQTPARKTLIGKIKARGYGELEITQGGELRDGTGNYLAWGYYEIESKPTR